MKIVSIEPTPSPNTMKVNLDQALPGGESNNYTEKNEASAPDQIRQLLSIEGVKGVYHVADFLALERNPRVDWKVILPQARVVFGEEESSEQQAQSKVSDSFGEIKVSLQMFKGIPMQLKVSDSEEEKRFGLPDEFMNAAMSTENAAQNVVVERKWVEQGARYGSIDEVGEQVVEEILATYNKERLEELVNRANSESTIPKQEKQKITVTLEMLNDPDWRKRYAALEKMDPTEADIPVLEKALYDEKASIRRMAVVYLGMIEAVKSLPLLCEAVLNDRSVTVRRTAGDTISDIGDPKAVPTMIQSLKDKNKLVRWRAAMFLYEVGDKTAIDALAEAQNDKEFEVAMQAKLALKRIEGGKEAEGSVWKQMTEIMNKKN